MNNLNEYTLKDLIKINSGKDYHHLSDGMIPVYGSGGIMCHVNDCLHEGECILLPRKGSLDNIMYVTGKFWTVDTMYWATVNNGIADMAVKQLVRNSTCTEILTMLGRKNVVVALSEKQVNLFINNSPTAFHKETIGELFSKITEIMVLGIILL